MRWLTRKPIKKHIRQRDLGLRDTMDTRNQHSIDLLKASPKIRHMNSNKGRKRSKDP